MHNFTLILLKWFAENRRDLPWRDTTDPYRIWLSEIILQQTRIQQGQEYWERFVRRWPTVDLLAAATEDEVLREWQGLGYYSRARNLHYAARQIVAAGAFPSTFDDIRRLKGVGDYTAAAIASIAFGETKAVVDGNVFRVLSRHFDISTPINTTEGKREFTALAQSLLPEDRASDFNQAMMDFGAIQCTPQSPQCPVCPLQESCCALRAGIVELRPVKRQTLQVKHRHLTYIYMRCQGQTAIHRRGEGDIWQGLWEPLLIEGEDADVTAVVQRISNGPYTLTAVSRGVRHILTHRILTADCFVMETARRPKLPADYIWTDEGYIDHYALPRLVEKLIDACRRTLNSRHPR